jgi:predicted O-methyltransferase YrrM
LERATHDPTFLEKVTSLTKLAVSRPQEALDRVVHFVEVNIDALTRHDALYSVVSLEQCVEGIAESLNRRLGAFVASARLRDLEAQIEDKSRALERARPFRLSHNGDPALGHLCYMACRMLQPEIVIETGTAYGITSAFLLSALRENGGGRLISIDLPPMGRDADRFVGHFIPEDLRSSWQLIRGSSSQHLSGLLTRTGHVNMFVHDSLHTYRNMIREFDSVCAHLSRPGIVVADDIDGNSAFAELIDRRKPAYAGVIREPGKGRLAGVAVFI